MDGDGMRHTWRRYVVWAVAIAAAITVYACFSTISLGTNNETKPPSSDDGRNNTETRTVSERAEANPLKVGTSIGNRIPDISGSDIDGVSFSLSDYNGKVIMLDFWGDW